MSGIICQNESITVWHDPQNGIVKHRMHKWTRGEDFRAALTAGAEAMEKHRATKWLSDDRSNLVLPDEDEAWAKTVWFPRVKAAGWKYWAIVKPEKLVATLNMQRFAEEFGKLGVEAALFSDVHEAEKWLRSK